MEHPTPEEIRIELDEIIGKLISDTPMNTHERKMIAMGLWVTHSYVAAHCKDNSPQNGLYRSIAEKAARDKRQEEDMAALREHQAFVERIFEKSEQYLKTIQLGGYAAFFGIWSITEKHLTSWTSSVAALLMIISISAFILWEVYKATILALTVKGNALASSTSLPRFVQIRMQTIRSINASFRVLSVVRPVALFISIVPALFAVCFLSWHFLVNIFASINAS